MKFDMSDRNRVTQRTDIAFWLHLLAAPLIVHSIVYPLLTESALSPGAAVAIVSLFAVLSLVALTVDRRALLVSSLLYLGYASSQDLVMVGRGFGKCRAFHPDRRRHRAGAVGCLAAPAPHCSQHSSAEPSQSGSAAAEPA